MKELVRNIIVGISNDLTGNKYREHRKAPPKHKYLKTKDSEVDMFTSEQECPLTGNDKNNRFCVITPQSPLTSDSEG